MDFYDNLANYLAKISYKYYKVKIVHIFSTQFSKIQHY